MITGIGYAKDAINQVKELFFEKNTSKRTGNANIVANANQKNIFLFDNMQDINAIQIDLANVSNQRLRNIANKKIQQVDKDQSKLFDIALNSGIVAILGGITAKLLSGVAAKGALATLAGIATFSGVAALLGGVALAGYSLKKFFNSKKEKEEWGVLKDNTQKNYNDRQSVGLTEKDINDASKINFPKKGTEIFNRVYLTKANELNGASDITAVFAKVDSSKYDTISLGDVVDDFVTIDDYAGIHTTEFTVGRNFAELLNPKNWLKENGKTTGKDKKVEITDVAYEKLKNVTAALSEIKLENNAKYEKVLNVFDLNNDGNVNSDDIELIAHLQNPEKKTFFCQKAAAVGIEEKISRMHRVYTDIKTGNVIPSNKVVAEVKNRLNKVAKDKIDLNADGKIDNIDKNMMKSLVNGLIVELDGNTGLRKMIEELLIGSDNKLSAEQKEEKIQKIRSDIAALYEEDKAA